MILKNDYSRTLKLCAVNRYHMVEHRDCTNWAISERPEYSPCKYQFRDDQYGVPTCTCDSPQNEAANG